MKVYFIINIIHVFHRGKHVRINAPLTERGFTSSSYLFHKIKQWRLNHRLH